MPLTIHARRALRFLLASGDAPRDVAIPAEFSPHEFLLHARGELLALGLVLHADAPVGFDDRLALRPEHVLTARGIDRDYEDAEVQWELMRAVPPQPVQRGLTTFLPQSLFDGSQVDGGHARLQFEAFMDAGVLTGQREAGHDLIRAGLTRTRRRLLAAEQTPDPDPPPLVIGTQITGPFYNSSVVIGNGNTVQLRFHEAIDAVARAVDDSELDDEDRGAPKPAWQRQCATRRTRARPCGRWRTSPSEHWAARPARASSRASRPRRRSSRTC